MIVLGIDPGSRRVGFGVIGVRGRETDLLAAGILPILSATDSGALKETQEGIGLLLEKWKPAVVAVEKIYFSKNTRTALAVAQARGVILSACAGAGLAIEEYSPNEVKAELTGYGGADKKAVAKMVRLILKRPDLTAIDDAMDALGVALVACGRLRVPGGSGNRI